VHRITLSWIVTDSFEHCHRHGTGSGLKLRKIQKACMMRSRVLFLSGRHEDARRLSQMLDALPLDFDHAGSLKLARALLQQADYNVVLTEAALPDGSWVDALQLARECPCDPQVIVTDPQADARFWAEALNLGAYDLLAQPFYEPEVRRILYNACTKAVSSQLSAASYSGA
jgi:two-component system, NtrC family, response regulator PilR